MRDRLKSLKFWTNIIYDGDGTNDDDNINDDINDDEIKDEEKDDYITAISPPYLCPLRLQIQATRH